MKKQVRKFCSEPNISLFKSLTPKLKKEFIKTSFDVLYQKTGDQEKALQILQVIGQIKTVHGYHVYTGDFDLGDDPFEIGPILPPIDIVDFDDLKPPSGGGGSSGTSPVFDFSAPTGAPFAYLGLGVIFLAVGSYFKVK